MNKLKKFENRHLEKLKGLKKIPNFNSGDTVTVYVKIIERKRERTQAFEGVCIAKKNAGINSSFTVRKISYGEGVERVFPLYSPNVARIEIKTKGRVRRAKLYYLRNLSGRKSKITEDKTAEKKDAENNINKDEIDNNKLKKKNEEQKKEKEKNEKSTKESEKKN
jgi:large subunit ribosomal protein L19